MASLQGKIAFITGAAMGNGEGIARVMAQKGAKVILADIDEQVFDTAKSIGSEAYPYLVDVADYLAVKNVADQVIAKFGSLDILVNNAGILREISIEEMDDAIRDLQYQVNVVGTWNCTKAFVPQMIKQKYGRIVNISSVTGPRVVDQGMTGYAMSKGAVLAFTKAVARDVAPYGITANAILPGFVLTSMITNFAQEMNPQNPQEVIDSLASGVPLRRLGKPEEIGYLAAFIASDEAAYITASEFLIDGGSTLPETSV